MSEPATETNPETPSGEDEGALDFDTVMNEYDAAVETKEEQKPTDDMEAKVRSLEEKLNERTQREEMEKIRTDLNAAAKVISENDVNLPEYIIRGALQELANENPKLVTAWSQRQNNPKGWLNVLRVHAQKMAKDIADLQSTETRNEVVSAVKGASYRKADSDQMKNFSEMSDQEFELFKMGKLR